MAELLTLHNVILALFILSLIWLIKVIIKKQTEYLSRAVIFSLFFLAALVFVQKTELKTLSFDEIKREFFPEKPLSYAYETTEGASGEYKYIRYSFPGPGPRLSLDLDSSGQFFSITDVSSLNRILEYLGHMKVKSGVPELASVTGSKFDVNRYRWDDYAEGILVIDRAICRDKEKVDSFNCIAFLTIMKRF